MIILYRGAEKRIIMYSRCIEKSMPNLLRPSLASASVPDSDKSAVGCIGFGSSHLPFDSLEHPAKSSADAKINGSLIFMRYTLWFIVWDFEANKSIIGRDEILTAANLKQIFNKCKLLAIFLKKR